MPRTVIDSDGHVLEDESLSECIEEPYRSQASKCTLRRVFPSFDFHHVGVRQLIPDAFGGDKAVGPEQWVAFIEQAGLRYSVLYPTFGLAIGNLSGPDWACAVARAYNNWLYDRYLKASPRLKGMALLPLQDVQEAVAELRRAVSNLGMLGAMLPSRGLPLDLGHKIYWPVYAEAQKLGCALAVHGGCHHGMGLDSFEAFVPIHGLGHPFSLMIAFTGMVYYGVLDRFAKLRLGFLEAGAGWVTFWMDRLDRLHPYFGEFNPRGVYLRPGADKRPSSYLEQERIYIGCEGSERGLAYAVKRAGNGHLLFASDFPHEIGPQDILNEIADVRESDGLSERDKVGILADNAKKFYQFDTEG